MCSRPCWEVISASSWLPQRPSVLQCCPSSELPWAAWYLRATDRQSALLAAHSLCLETGLQVGHSRWLTFTFDLQCSHRFHPLTTDTHLNHKIVKVFFFSSVCVQIDDQRLHTVHFFSHMSNRAVQIDLWCVCIQVMLVLLYLVPWWSWLTYLIWTTTPRMEKERWVKNTTFKMSNRQLSGAESSHASNYVLDLHPWAERVQRLPEGPRKDSWGLGHWRMAAQRWRGPVASGRLGLKRQGIRNTATQWHLGK